MEIDKMIFELKYVGDRKKAVTHGSWSHKGPAPKTNYIYKIEFELDDNGNPLWDTAVVTGK